MSVPLNSPGSGNESQPILGANHMLPVTAEVLEDPLPAALSPEEGYKQPLWWLYHGLVQIAIELQGEANYWRLEIMGRRWKAWGPHTPPSSQAWGNAAVDQGRQRNVCYQLQHSENSNFCHSWQQHPPSVQEMQFLCEHRVSLAIRLGLVYSLWLDPDAFKYSCCISSNSW